jgi:hypothetical protein
VEPVPQPDVAAESRRRVVLCDFFPVDYSDPEQFMDDDSLQQLREEFDRQSGSAPVESWEQPDGPYIVPVVPTPDQRHEQFNSWNVSMRRRFAEFDAARRIDLEAMNCRRTTERTSLTPADRMLAEVEQLLFGPRAQAIHVSVSSQSLPIN